MSIASPASFRLPAEWERQAGVLVAWPHAQTDWAQRLLDVEQTYVALIAAIARFETVIVCVADNKIRARAQALLSVAGIATAGLRYVEVEYDDTWLRDSGPITLTDGTRFQLNDFSFTGWGGKFKASRDDQLIEGLIARKLFQPIEHRRIDWALEGGGIESDGAGTLLTTWRCLQQRHPLSSREAISQILQESLMAKRVLWLEHGYLEGDDTDAHIDTLARFAPGDAIVFQACDDPTDPHYAELARMREELANLRTTDGRPYTLYPLPWAKRILDEGRRLAASYANFLIINDAVLIPSYDDLVDTTAAHVLATAFPNREIISVPCKPLIWQNGSLHCVTMQLPEGVLA